MAVEPGGYSERIEGPTLNGGAYAIVYWKGPGDALATREDAIGGEIVEFDGDGKAIFRTYFSKVSIK